VSRLALAGFGVVTVALAVGLVQLLLPRSGSSVTAVSTQASSARLLPAPNNDNAEGFAQTNPSSSISARTSAHLPASSQVRTTSAVENTRPVSRPAEVVSTVMLTNSNRAAVPVGDGRHALTTAASLTGGQTIEVQGADGISTMATVTSVDRAANVAVLDLGEPALGAASAISDELPIDGDVVSVGSSGDAIVRATDAGLIVEGAEPCDEGTPVLDEEGALVGLATMADDGTVHLVTLADLTRFEAALVEIGVWVGVRFDAETLMVTEVPAGSPADLIGVLPGDVLVAIDEVQLRSIDDVWVALSPHQPNDVVTLTVRRGPLQIVYSVTLDVRPS